MPNNQTIHNSEDKNKIESIIRSARLDQSFRRFPPSFLLSKKVNINEENRKKQLENDSYAQDIILKRRTLLILFGFLFAETITIFTFSFFQAIHFRGFRLDEWSFKLLVTATITQITFMLQVAVNHLFPKK